MTGCGFRVIRRNKRSVQRLSRQQDPEQSVCPDVVCQDIDTPRYSLKNYTNHPVILVFILRKSYSPPGSRAELLIFVTAHIPRQWGPLTLYHQFSPWTQINSVPLADLLMHLVLYGSFTPWEHFICLFWCFIYFDTVLWIYLCCCVICIVLLLRISIVSFVFREHTLRRIPINVSLKW